MKTEFSKATPGPWTIKYNGETAPEIRAGIRVVGVALFSIPQLHEEETLANAALIAASPDLLQACQEAEDLLHRMVNGGMKRPGKPDRIGDAKGYMREARDILRGAIAKAGHYELGIAQP